MSVTSKLQSRLWSKSTRKIHIKRDGRYIIKQLLAYGTMEDLRWLLSRYPKKTIRTVAKTMKRTEFHPSIYKFINLLFLSNDQKRTR